MRAWGSAGNTPHQNGRRDTDGTEKGRKLQCHSWTELGSAGLFIDSNKFQPTIRELFGKGSASGKESRHSVAMKKLEALDSDFQSVAWLRVFNEDGARHWVRSGPSIFHDAFDHFESLRNLLLPRPGQSQPLQTSRNHGLNANSISGGDPQYRLQLCVVVAPVNVLRQQLQVVCSGLRAA